VFASSLDIRVEGAVPIKDDTSEDTTFKPSRLAAASDSDKRAPRKSKMDALAALNNQTWTSSTVPDDDESTTNLTARYRSAPAIPVSPALNMTSVKTSTPCHQRSVRPPPRPFGLKDCPEYYPTAEQFTDPMEYIKSIADEAKEYGICKIVPPSDWKMPFVTDTEVCNRTFY